MNQETHEESPDIGPGDGIELVTGERLQAFLEEMRHAIAYRAFKLWETRARMHGDDLTDWFRAEEELTSHLRHEVREPGGSVVLETSLAGLEQSQIALAVEPRRVILRVRKPAGSLPETFRIADLPVEVDTSSAHASMHQGVLVLTVHRKGL